MLRADAQEIHDRIVNALAPFCQRIEVAGSFRRRKSEVGDLDFVVIPKTQVLFVKAVWDLYGRKPEKCGDKYLMLASFDGIQVDFYLATPETWPTLWLIRTGSAEHNILLCARAKQVGLRLHADGRGLEWFGGFLRAESEQDIFDALDLPYREPWEREC